MSLRRPSHAVIVAYLALVVALSGTGYAAAKIDGKTLKNASVTGKKLKPDTLTGKQVDESSLATVPSATRADTAGKADTATTAGSASTLGSLGPNAFAKATQLRVAGPFTTNPTGPENTFFSFPELDLSIVTPREPNSPGMAGAIEVQHAGTSPVSLLYTYRSWFGDGGGQYGGSDSGINFLVNGPSTGDDFIELTFFDASSGRAANIECTANPIVTDVPIVCRAATYGF